MNDAGRKGSVRVKRLAIGVNTRFTLTLTYLVSVLGASNIPPLATKAPPNAYLQIKIDKFKFRTDVYEGVDTFDCNSSFPM